MNFGTFLGNEGLKERLRAALTRSRLSHCYLLTGPSGSGKHTLARLLAAAMECTAAQKPCLCCSQCRKVLSDTHPDVITVTEPERKTLSVKKVRTVCSELYIRPNEGEKKIYIFPQAQDLNTESQNALLKCIEEPPDYGVFFFLSEHAHRLLPTIRSRCAELRLSPLPEELLKQELKKRHPDKGDTAIAAACLRSGGYLGQALELLQNNTELLPQSKALLEACAAKDPLALQKVLVPMERLKRDQLQPVILQCRTLFASALTTQKGLPPLSPECEILARSRSCGELLAGEKALEYALRLLQANVSPAHICGMLAVSLD